MRTKSNIKNLHLANFQILATQKWQDTKDGLGAEVKEAIKSLKVIEHNRESLKITLSNISNILKDVLEKYEYKEDLNLYVSFCPMAFSGEGAYWIQDSDKIANPYFEGKMLKCGEVKKTFGRKIIKAEPKGSVGHQH